MAKSDQRSFRYKPRSKEDVKERANMRGGGFDSVFNPKYKRYKMRDGKNLIRVLPPTWEDARHYGYDIFINYGIGADNQSYLSLSKMKNEADPLAEARREADREGDEKLAKELQPRQRVVMWIIDRMDEDEGPQLFDAPQTVDKALANLSLDEDTKEVTLVDDPENGCDFRFYKEGSGLKTDYDASKMKLMKPSPLCDDEKLQEEWLDYVKENPIPDALQFYDYDHISAVFNGTAKSKKDADDDEETPKRRARSRVTDDDEEVKPRRRAADDDDAEEKPQRRAAAEDDDEEKPKRRASVEDDEPDEKPKGRTRGRLSADDEEPDEKPKRRAPVDDDEPDEKPKRRAAAEDDDETPKKGESIRDRLKNRRQASKDDDDD